MIVPPPSNLLDTLAASEVAFVRSLIDQQHIPIYVDEANVVTERPPGQTHAPEAQALGLCGRYLGVRYACERAPGHPGQHTDDPGMRGQ